MPLFTCWCKEAGFDPHLTTNISTVPVNSTVKVLGVIFVSTLNFGENARGTKVKLQKRKNARKKIGCSDGGCTKETSSDLQSFRWERFELRCSNLGFHISNTNWNHLQIQQNIALRTITGCVKMTDIMTNKIRVNCCLLKLTEMFVEPFLPGSYQSHRADPKKTSTSFRPMRLTLNDIYRDRMKQRTNNKEQ